MPNLAHKQSQELAVQAAELMRLGQVREAQALYKDAASLEEAALADIPADKPRTRGILAVSLVSLFYKAGLYGKAKKVAHSFLAQDSLPGFARDQLGELLDAIQARSAGESAKTSNVLEIKEVENRRGTDRTPVKFQVEYHPDDPEPILLRMKLPLGSDYVSHLSWSEWERISAWLNWKKVEA